MNLAWTEPGMIGVVGWAKDPDANRPIDVIVAVEGGGLVRRTAGVYNPYLGGPVSGRYRSFLVGVDVPAGSRVVCVAAINVGRGRPFRLLGCARLEAASADPVGTLEQVELTSAGDTMRVGGWALDPETPFPLPMTVTIDGTAVDRLVASDDRPDLAGAVPSKSTRHGFGGEVHIDPGVHVVCVRAQNLGRGADRTIGCRRLDVPATVPTGALDDVVVGTDELVVSGWATDPDANGPISVRVSDAVRGVADDPTITVVAANGDRPDVGSALGIDPRVGVRARIPITEPGRHDICLTARNAGRGRDQLLGCRVIEVDDHRPTAEVDELSASGTTMSVTGWAFDVDSAGPRTVEVTVDGTTTTTTANLERPDLIGRLGGRATNVGFAVDIDDLDAGRHSVCVTVVDAPTPPGSAAITGDRSPPCGAIVIRSNSPSSLGLGTTGSPTGSPIPVGTRTGRLADLDRDAGVSVQLHDGSVLWLFGDSATYDANGRLESFVNGTGAWAPGSDRSWTQDATDPSGRPYLLAAPTPEFPSCPSSMPQRAMWPLSAVAVRSSATTDRVIVHLADMCLGSMTEFSYRGIAVADWTYDRTAPPPGVPCSSVCSARWSRPPDRSDRRRPSTRTASPTCTHVIGRGTSSTLRRTDRAGLHASSPTTSVSHRATATGTAARGWRASRTPSRCRCPPAPRPASAIPRRRSRSRSTPPTACT